MIPPPRGSPAFPANPAGVRMSPRGGFGADGAGLAAAVVFVRVAAAGRRAGGRVWKVADRWRTGGGWEEDGDRKRKKYTPFSVLFCPSCVVKWSDAADGMSPGRAGGRRGRRR